MKEVHKTIGLSNEILAEIINLSSNEKPLSVAFVIGQGDYLDFGFLITTIKRKSLFLQSQVNPQVVSQISVFLWAGVGQKRLATTTRDDSKYRF